MVSVIVHNLDHIWTNIGPDKTDTVLIIDTDTMLTFAITCESFQMIARRYTEFIQ
jgi:hypothetical protein